MADIGSIQGREVPVRFKTPVFSGPAYICHADAAYISWYWNSADTGYIIYRDGIEIFNGTTKEFRNAAKMFNNTDHDTNFFSRSHDKLIYEDDSTVLKKFHEYKYTVRAYMETDDEGILLSAMSQPCVLRVE